MWLKKILVKIRVQIIIFKKKQFLIQYKYTFGGHSWRRAQANDCKRDRLWIRFPLEDIKYFIFSFLCFIVEVKRGGKWGSECLNIQLLDFRLHAGYSAKLKKNILQY